MSKFASTVRRFVRDETGASMAEYALLVAAIALVAVAAVKTLGTNVNGIFTKAHGEIKTS